MGISTEQSQKDPDMRFQEKQMSWSHVARSMHGGAAGVAPHRLHVAYKHQGLFGGVPKPSAQARLMSSNRAQPQWAYL